MSLDRSEQVIADYKKRKLAVNAMQQIQEIIRDLDRDRATDLRLARIGMAIIVTVIGVSIYLLLSASRVTLF